MSLFSSLRPKANLAHNAFDKSRRDVFSLKTGMLTPCFVEHTIDDATYEVDSMSIVRTNPVQSAPFARMKQNMEYYFVPYSQIFHDFERIYFERGEHQRNVSNTSDVSVSSVVPHFVLPDVLSELFHHYCRLHLYNDFVAEAESFVESSEVVSERNAAWRALSSIKNSFSSEVGDFVDVHGRHCVEDQLRNFDLLGYGNYLPVFKTFYAMYGAAGTGGTYTSTQQFIMNWLANLQLADFSVDEFISALNSTSNSYRGSGTIFYTWLEGFYVVDGDNRTPRMPNIFAMAAYLKVWSDFYRNSQYDVNINYSYYFNYDYVSDDSLALIDNRKVFEMLKPRYRQYKKDVFTGSYPNAQFGSVAVASLGTGTSVQAVIEAGSLDISTVKNNGSSAPSLPLLGSSKLGAGMSGELMYKFTDGSSQAGASPSLTNTTAITIGSGSDTGDLAISALAIRQVMAFQRYKERILRAGNRLPSLQTALFGDKSRYMEDLYADFLGANDAPIDFNSVAATAQSDDVNVGELASNGVATHGGRAFKYHSHDFGIILGLMYVLPETEYESYMVEPMNTKLESFDYFKPDFQNLGLQPVFNFDFNFMPTLNGSYNDAVLGYMARYWEYKTSIDKVHGEFYSNLPFDLNQGLFAQLPPSVGSVGSNVFASRVGAFSQFVTPRSSNSFRLLVLNSLYVEPTSVDGIFYEMSNEYQSTDQFKVNMYHDVKCILPMSVIGLPQ